MRRQAAFMNITSFHLDVLEIGMQELDRREYVQLMTWYKNRLKELPRTDIPKRRAWALEILNLGEIFGYTREDMRSDMIAIKEEVDSDIY